MTATDRDGLGDPADLAAALESWFARAARDLPWRRPGRGTRRDPYATLVSELMLQQTQAARAAERFSPFMARFPRPADLARADVADVLALWSGLGYYRRARLLHAAAQSVVDAHGGAVPADRASLRALPGVGPYTAGAIASLAHDRAEPMVDGNVTRVLLRIAGRDGAAGEAGTDRWAWDRSGELVRAASSPGDLNESLMELGATVCTPRAPRCAACPVSDRCAARRDGRQEEIPRPKPRAAQRVVRAHSVVVRDRRGRVLLERRPDGGMWGGLWQVPTVELDGAEGAGGSDAGCGVGCVRTVERDPIGSFTHQTTHRLFEVRVYRGDGGRATGGRRWVSGADLAGLGVSSLQRRVLVVAGVLGG